ncbi:succinyl-diaminopimelate desuccinylase [Levilactobacillus senmaizukei DSM 21775 = NBRC 103853]|uniref:Probable succinyl-diaminopimelate desuccinylase n=1 Tax=Levilactobacillus senmaizukei DSM 21775 = NBRC 103853 TaxID=1423803 RepID=A0A0R2DLR8_9LACO|nr:ArgE/DapE family deacylase [Levilactobacillus senmaizukei]KRN02725.1 succinyl-diaminopimelate desuccinylase [Levilactobacillus senmaizukei DSM 21775 = NBRC 103853]
MEDSEQIQILQHLIQINSVNGNEAAVADYIKQLFAEHGISSTITPYAEGRSNIVAEIGNHKTDQVLALAGHLDTVATGDLADWKFNPFAAHVENNRLYGRGSADMKSGLAGMIITFLNLADHQDQLNGRLRFIGTVGEENGAMGSRDLTKQGIADDISAMVLGEPTGGNIVYAHNGSLNYHVYSQGVGAHSSMPEKGVNAITNLIKYVTAEATEFDDAPVSPELGPLVHSVTVFEGGEQVNSIPAKAELQGNIRPIPEFDNEAVINRLNETVNHLNEEPNVNLTLHIDYSFKPIISRKDSQLVQLTKQIADTEFGTPVNLQVIHGATDASEYIKSKNVFPVIVYGSGQWYDAHALNESVDLDQFHHVQQVYEQLTKKFLA